MTDARLDYLDALGVDVWLERGAPTVSAVEIPATVAAVATAAPVARAPVPDARPVDALDWGELEARVAACQQCELCQTRAQTVFGVGDRQARWMLIGEAPGAEEDRRGEPFVGRAGQLLDAMLKGAGFARQQVFIANVLKCRPPQNRDPSGDESTACLPYLRRQIALVKPDLILAVGRIAAQRLLDTTEPLGKIRGRVHQLEGERKTPVVVTYHPAYLLRSPAQKRKAWEDLVLAHRVARGEVH
ncbi:MAG: uracil-DNA glycosylase family protein [Gammaproteobacteria bacterium]